jgi:hypothetical protein
MEEDDDGDEAAEEAEDAAAVPAKASGSGRRAAQGVKSYMEVKEKKRGKKEEMVKAKAEPKAESEAEAVAQTAGEKSGSTRRWVRLHNAECVVGVCVCICRAVKTGVLLVRRATRACLWPVWQCGSALTAKWHAPCCCCTCDMHLPHLASVAAAAGCLRM